MTAVDRFATLAESFGRWAADGADAGETAARHALAHLAELFSAALALPDAEPVGGEPPHVTGEEWDRVFRACRRLPIQHYGTVFDPLTLPTDGLDVGDLADDLADVYQEVVSGLRAYQGGDTAGAAWQWRFTFWCHWGRHAASAVSVLRTWLEENGAH